MHHCPPVNAAHMSMLRPSHQHYYHHAQSHHQQQQAQFPTTARHCQLPRPHAINDVISARPNSVECGGGNLIDLSYHQPASRRFHGAPPGGTTPVNYSVSQCGDGDLRLLMSPVSAAGQQLLTNNANIQVCRVVYTA